MPVPNIAGKLLPKKEKSKDSRTNINAANTGGDTHKWAAYDTNTGEKYWIATPLDKSMSDAEKTASMEKYENQRKKNKLGDGKFNVYTGKPFKKKPDTGMDMLKSAGVEAQDAED